MFTAVFTRGQARHLQVHWHTVLHNYRELIRVLEHKHQDALYVVRFARTLAYPIRRRRSNWCLMYHTGRHLVMTHDEGCLLFQPNPQSPQPISAVTVYSKFTIHKQGSSTRLFYPHHCFF